MSQIITDHDSFTGITEQFHKDPVTGQVRIKQTQDVESLLKVNKERLNQSSSTFEGEFHHMASVPVIMIEIWREELKAKGFPDPNPLAKCNEKWLLAKLNDPEFSGFKTKAGRI